MFLQVEDKLLGQQYSTKCTTHVGTSSLNFRLMRTIKKFYELLEWDRMGEVHNKEPRLKMDLRVLNRNMETGRQWSNRKCSNSKRTT